MQPFATSCDCAWPSNLHLTTAIAGILHSTRSLGPTGFAAVVRPSPPGTLVSPQPNMLQCPNEEPGSMATQFRPSPLSHIPCPIQHVILTRLAAPRPGACAAGNAGRTKAGATNERGLLDTPQSPPSLRGTPGKIDICCETLLRLPCSKSGCSGNSESTSASCHGCGSLHGTTPHAPKGVPGVHPF